MTSAAAPTVAPVGWRITGDVYATETPGKLMSADGLRVTGTPHALDAFHAAMRESTVPLGRDVEIPVDPADPVSVYAAALYVIRGPSITGNPPDLPLTPLPEDAIA